MADLANVNLDRTVRVAVTRIKGFSQRFDQAHCNLAYHAAFPLVLTPDLLYQIWANFVPEAPWTAVARILLSPLCKLVSYEMYEMDIPVRNLLLRELKQQFGQKRLEELSEFLLDYVLQQFTDDPVRQNLAQTHERRALAYTKPKDAARKLAEVFSTSVQKEDEAEILRLASLTEPILIKKGIDLNAE